MAWRPKRVTLPIYSKNFFNQDSEELGFVEKRRVSQELDNCANSTITAGTRNISGI
jgi:hypothetical protein